MIQFVIGLHNHQPVGNFDHVFADAYDRAYLPFLELLEYYPALRVSLHHTGPLLLWLAGERPEYLERLGVLVERGQVELLGGAFYEPVLPVIPERDRIGQIEAMSAWLEDVFGVRPRGMWLAERVWEPTLPRALRAAGMEFTILDDSHFRSVGIRDEGVQGYWLTEDLGDQVAVFPINAELRYRIPYADPQETIRMLREMAGGPGVMRTAVMADDGEKFGVWPDSFRHCYEDGWLYRFAEQVSNNRDWLHMRTFSEVLDTTEPLGRVYLPAASYIEMMEWALPSDSLNEYKDFVHAMKGEEHLADGREFVRGGFWRSFFSKYDESNHIHKKMLRVSRKLTTVPDDFRKSPHYATAVDHLWRGQCNCAYWHGVFGGLYLANLRNALYENLIAAEAMADEATHGESGWTQITAEDFDADGGQELIAESAGQIVMLQPHKGGMMIEHDARALRFNPLDTLMRRREAYHRQLEGSTRQGEHQFRVKDLRVTGALAEDWYRRGSLIDHFLSDDATPEQFREAVYPETGDFVNAPYACEWKKTKAGAEITLSRDGAVMTDTGQHAVTVKKTLICASDEASVKIRYEVSNRSQQPLNAQFGVEFNVNLLAGDAPDRVHEIDGFRLGALNKMNSTGEIPDAKTFRVLDGWKKLKVEWALSEAAVHWRCPIETVSNSEGGIEKIYQSTVVMPVWSLNLKPGRTWSVEIDYGIFQMAK